MLNQPKRLKCRVGGTKTVQNNTNAPQDTSERIPERKLKSRASEDARSSVSSESFPISRNGAGSVGVHEIQDHAHGSLISAAGVDHGVVNCAIRPFHLEVFLNEVRALTIYAID